jgi:OOP family OmpA-OmpF porin
MLAVFAASGCALQDRKWGSCAIGGAVIGGTVGGITGGVATNNAQDSPTDEERLAGILGGTAAGLLLGALLGHAICDPVKEPPPPPPVAAPPPPPPPPAKGTKIATVGEAHFDFDRAELKPSATEVLREAVRTLKDNPDLRVVVEGHTDSVGSDAYNQRLSERRAEAVKRYLVAQGIEASRLSTHGYGESKPAASNDTAEGRARNRRVEIVAE